METTSLTSAVERPSAEQPLAGCVAALARGRRFLIAMHEFPDGDALGSALALRLLLLTRGREVVVYSPQGAPANLRFLPGAERIVTSLQADARFDVAIACDSADPERLGPDFPGPDRRGELLNIDHHPRTKPFGDVNLVDSQAASAGAIVHRILKAMAHPLDRDLATCLWVSLVSDTGSFRHSNTNAECMRIAAELMEQGLRPGEIASKMFESQPLARVKLLGEVLKTITVSPCGQIAWVTASREVFERAGTSDETADGFISYPRSIAGVEVALLFREESATSARVSFRSRGRVDVGALATRLGGGGHHNASGCSVPGGLDEARAVVLREVERALDRLRA